MKKLALCFALVALAPAGARAGLILGTSNPPGAPLTLSSGTISAAMLATVVRDSPAGDLMAAWQFRLVILPDAGAAGTLLFNSPATGFPPDPAGYVFGGHGVGIAALNSGGLLDTNDFDIDSGTAVPDGGANLLRLDFLASADAAGRFGVYAQQGDAFTVWTDDGFSTRYFDNVPNGTGLVRIGEVQVLGLTAVPEPSTLALLGTAAAALAGWRWRRWRKRGSDRQFTGGSD